ncbi:MAG: L,D-transpeptidase family protein [Pseudomonadota bacterium]
MTLPTRYCSMIFWTLFSVCAVAQQFPIPTASPDVIGELALATTVFEDTMSDLARAYGQGYKEMRLANPEIDPWLPGEDSEIVVPNLFVLPDADRKGIVINVPEMRMYVYHADGDGPVVDTYPISIGRQDWVTPHGRALITQKVKNPNWFPPESIREEHAAEGDPLPKMVPAGPDNPLGAHALRLNLPGYLIHGTNKPYGIGMRVTHGCVRMYPKDVARVFEIAKVGTPVHIVNQPFKVGISYDKIFLEVHPHLQEDNEIFSDHYSIVIKLVLERLAGEDVQLRWPDVRRALKDKSGVPTVIGVRSSS